MGAYKVTEQVQMRYEQAFDRLYHSIIKAGYPVDDANPSTGIIHFHSMMSLYSFGCDFTGQVVSVNQGRSQIIFIGRMRNIIDVDLPGERKKMVQKIMQQFNNL